MFYNGKDVIKVMVVIAVSLDAVLYTMIDELFMPLNVEINLLIVALYHRKKVITISKPLH